MKKLIVLLFITSLFSFELEKGDTIYCRPEIKSCIQNLEVLKGWLEYDYKDDKIPSYVYEEYLLVLNNTRLSLEMILDNKGQCDTTIKKPAKFKYNIDH